MLRCDWNLARNGVLTRKTVGSVIGIVGRVYLIHPRCFPAWGKNANPPVHVDYQKCECGSLAEKRIL
jgi:hypothetical protein